MNMRYLLIVVFLIITSVGAVFYFGKKDTNKIINKTAEADTTREYKIIAFGDSLTAGYGVNLNESYPAILEKYLKVINTNIKIINAGVSGETTTGGLDRVDFIISQKPQLVLLGLGANDMLRSINPDVTKTNLEKIIIALKENDIPMVILGMKAQIGNGFAYKKKFDSIYADLSAKYDLPLVPFFLENVILVKDLNINDGIHPNRQGYEKIVKENVLPVLKKVID